MNRLLALLGSLLLTAMLSACVIASVDPLVTDDEATTPLPAHAVFFGYKASPEGYSLSSDAPNALDLDGTVYRAANGELVLRLVSIAGEADTYLLAATGDDSTIYGLAHYSDGLLDLKAMLGDDAEAVLKAAAIPGLTFGNEATMVTSRAAVDAAIALFRDGSLQGDSAVFFVGDNEAATPPANLVREGGMLRPAS